MNRIFFLFLLGFSVATSHAQVGVAPAQSDSLRQVSLSNLTQDGHTMIALIIGQSNAANHGKVAYAPTHSSVFNYCEGKLYTAKDPLMGATGTGGSVWTHLADMLIDSSDYKKIIIIPIAVGGSAIGRWTSGDCYLKLQQTLRLLDSQHIKLTHIFWHQGETDNILNTTGETYKKSLDTILNTIRSYHQDAPMYVSIASYHPAPVAKPLGVDNVIRKAQMEFINEHKGILLGPDTDELIYAIHRFDAVHFSDFGMQAFARQWLKAIKEKKEVVTVK
ncbi:sialate O-acetylesterase [Chitinophagaceae bacterium 26-R-25]|nr:sialate O-acetylesterase [Chitinophagaceae bacterium 26-R-25]